MSTPTHTHAQAQAQRHAHIPGLTSVHPADTDKHFYSLAYDSLTYRDTAYLGTLGSRPTASKAQHSLTHAKATWTHRYK